MTDASEERFDIPSEQVIEDLKAQIGLMAGEYALEQAKARGIIRILSVRVDDLTNKLDQFGAELIKSQEKEGKK